MWLFNPNNLTSSKHRANRANINNEWTTSSVLRFARYVFFTSRCVIVIIMVELLRRLQQICQLLLAATCCINRRANEKNSVNLMMTFRSDAVHAQDMLVQSLCWVILMVTGWLLFYRRPNIWRRSQSQRRSWTLSWWKASKTIWRMHRNYLITTESGR